MLLYFYSIFGSPSKNGDVGECNALLRTSQQLFSTFLHPRMLKKEETGVTGHTHTLKKNKVHQDLEAAGGLGRHSGDQPNGNDTFSKAKFTVV